ncbi:MAG: UDP-glucose 4-epimerase [Acidimicrobiaceae bacterium]
MRVVVTGAAGFIGSNLVDALLDRGDSVVGIDNLSTGQRRFLTDAVENERFRFVEGDLVDGLDLVPVIEGADAVVHLAANADVRFGWQDTRRDLRQNVVMTLEIADAMRVAGVRKLLFSSTGSVYGESPIVPTPEDAPFPRQTSLYGASKAAAEGYLSAYAEAGELDVTIFRFVSVMGRHYTHGHVIDFVSALTSDPTRLRVLGDGNQKKSYLDVSDCVAAVISRLDQSVRFEVFNLGTDEYCTVRDSIRWITDRLGVEPELAFTGGDRGWVGDNPFIFLDTSAIRATGWRPRLTIKDAVERTIDYLVSNPWLTEAHKPDRASSTPLPSPP